MIPTPMPDTTLTSAELDELWVRDPYMWIKEYPAYFEPMRGGEPASTEFLDGPTKPGASALYEISPNLWLALISLARAGLEAGKAEESMRESVPALMAKLPALPKDLFEMYPGMSANSHEHEVKRYAATAIRALPLTGVDKP